MEGLEYLVVEPACEVNEKGTREKNDGNENLSLDDNEKIGVESDAGSFVEEDWNDPEQDEVPKYWQSPKYWQDWCRNTAEILAGLAIANAQA